MSVYKRRRSAAAGEPPARPRQDHSSQQALCLSRTRRECYFDPRRDLASDQSQSAGVRTADNEPSSSRRCSRRRRSGSARRTCSVARRALGGARDREERADLEAALPCVAQRLFVAVGNECRAVVRDEALEELRSQASLITPESGVAGQCEMPPVPKQRDPLGLRVARTAQRAAELVGARERREGRALAIDIHGNDGQVVTRRHEVQRHHDAVIELPLLRVRDVDVAP